MIGKGSLYPSHVKWQMSNISQLSDHANSLYFNRKPKKNRLTIQISAAKLVFIFDIYKFFLKKL